jgi:hypothetical protein
VGQLCSSQSCVKTTNEAIVAGCCVKTTNEAIVAGCLLFALLLLLLLSLCRPLECDVARAGARGDAHCYRMG